MAERILITGASGLVGRALIVALLDEGYDINILSRYPKKIKGVNCYTWDVDNQHIAPDALTNVNHIIHLAGEGIAAKRWSTQRKKELIDSRTKTAQLLFDTVKSNNLPVKSFVSASAVGFYGDGGQQILEEIQEPGTDFMATCCVAWEKASSQFEKLGIRVVQLRLGVILSKKGGALKSMDKPINWYLGAPLGDGRQWVPWIHLDDVVKLFVYAIENQNMLAAYNACAPQPVTNNMLTLALGKALHRPIWPFPIPKFVLKLILGEMSAVVLNSNHASAAKILSAGYQFKYTNLAQALTAIYGN